MEVEIRAILLTNSRTTYSSCHSSLSSETRMNYEEWYEDEPSWNAEECLEMRGDFQYRWNDLTCSWPGQTLCQIGETM